MPYCAERFLVELNCSLSERLREYPRRSSLTVRGVKMWVSVITRFRALFRKSPDAKSAESIGGGISPGGDRWLFEKLNLPKMESESEILWSMRTSNWLVVSGSTGLIR